MVRTVRMLSDHRGTWLFCISFAWITSFDWKLEWKTHIHIQNGLAFTCCIYTIWRFHNRMASICWQNPYETKWTGKWALANQQKPDPHNTNCIPVFSLNNHHLVVIPIFAVVVDKPKKKSPTLDAIGVG